MPGTARRYPESPSTQTEAALAIGQAAPAADPAFAQAVALQQAGDREGAAAAYRAFLKEHPSNVEARSNLGVVLAQLGRYEEAIEAYRAALTVDPAQAKIRLNLGIALYKAARYGDAATELAKVHKAQPDNLQARFDLAPRGGKLMVVDVGYVGVSLSEELAKEIVKPDAMAEHGVKW